MIDQRTPNVNAIKDMKGKQSPQPKLGKDATTASQHSISMFVVGRASPPPHVKPCLFRNPLPIRTPLKQANTLAGTQDKWGLIHVMSSNTLQGVSGLRPLAR